VRLSPYDFSKQPQDVIDFKDQVTQVINFSKYQNKVLIEGTPTWSGVEGESVWCYVTSATAGYYNFYTYYFVNSAWRFTIFIGATA
jgi:hypothetical protein